jgi:leucyl/phenylalanyl-tRNA--protein transferase
MYLLANDDDFPDVELANQEPNGLLAMGGDLRPERLVRAYQRGIFPWYSEGEPILWWSPDPRSVIFPDQLKVSRSLTKTLKKGVYDVTFDQSFDKVVWHCAQPRSGDPRTWINREMQQAYSHLHKLGLAHSVEVYSQDELVGGLYGVALGKVFFGESMFSLKTDASKVGFVHLVRHLKNWDFQLIDCQIQSSHLDSLGAVSVERSQFVSLLTQYCRDTSRDFWQHVLSLEEIVNG